MVLPNFMHNNQSTANSETRHPETCDVFPKEDHSYPECNMPSSTELSAEIVRHRHELISVMVCSLGSLSHGLAFGFSSPATPQLLAVGFLTEEQVPWFECLLIAGAVVGGLATSSLIHLLGRKGSMLVSGVPFLSGWLCLTFSRTCVPLYAGRFLVGIAYGMVEIVCPVYVAEIVSDELLTPAAIYLALGDTLGTVIQYSLGLFLTARMLSALSIIPVVAMTIGMIFMPESPRWLIHTGQKLRALQSIQWLRMSSKDDAKNEFTEINTCVSCQSVCYSETFREMPNVYRPLVACAVLFVFQQFSGITPIMFNCEWILNQAASGAVLGNDSFRSGQLPAVVLASTRMVMTVCGLMLINRLGRKPLFLFGGVLMMASLSTLGLFLFYKEYENDALVWLPLVSLIVFVSAHSLAWSNIPRVVIMEMSSRKVKGLASGIGTTASWLSAFFVTQQFFSWHTYLDLNGIFLLYGFFCLAGSLFALKYMPEVKIKEAYHTGEDLTVSYGI